MYKEKSKAKKIVKRICASVLLLCMIVALFPGKEMNQGSYAVAAEAEGKVTRGVVESLGQLPQYNNQENNAAERGTADNPFVILEIVPYEEYAEFGYLISGCEPVAVEDMYGRSEMTTIKSLNDAYIEQKTAYFFSDEPEGDINNYDNGGVSTSSAAGKIFEGYYEYVGTGKGNLLRTIESKQESTAETKTENVVNGTESVDDTEESIPETETETKTVVTFTKSDQGDFIWHTVNEFEKEDYAGISFTDKTDKALSNEDVGTRFYTTRTATDSDIVTTATTYYDYDNYDHFLTNTLGLEPEQADNYSIVIKTITPAELNNTQEWINYADLIYLSPKSHVGGLPEIWKKYNRLGKTSDVTNYAANAYETNDFSWDTTLKLYNKITAETDFAAIVMDDGVYNAGLTSATQKNVTTKVYDWNLRDTGATASFTASKNNVYKLSVMLLSMDSSLFKSIYLDGENPLIQDGNLTLQTGDAANYWSVQSFFLVQNAVDASNTWNHWTSTDFWNNYHSTANFTGEAYKYWVQDRVFTYKGDTSIAQIYASTSLPSGKEGSIFTDFSQYIKNLGKTEATSSDAVRYILNIGGANVTPNYPDKIRVLDIEPCVGLNTSYQPDWVLTENYIRMLLPQFTGEIEIVHQTTAEFNGKTDDLNNEYQMIYLGLDTGAYNTKYMSIQLNNNSWVSGKFPDWNDNSLDGKIYLHTGDKLFGGQYDTDSRTRSIKFLWSITNNSNVESTEMRFPGNDITTKKKTELANFIAAGYPVVAEKYLYNQEKNLIDEKSNIYAFFEELSGKKGNGIYSTTDTTGILNAVASINAGVTFTVLPAEYNGETNGAVIANPNYLPMDSGRSYLSFGFSVNQEGYSYHIYVDQDRNSKFEAGEVVYSSTASVGDNYYKYRLANSLIGLMQWKIEVYRTDNEAIRFVETGCSAAKNNSGNKKEINVLQIMPKDASYDGYLNLEESSLFKKYYENLADYSVTVKTITLTEYESYFKDSNFSYDMSAEINDENPKNLDKLKGNLENYNMIIVGFGDAYGSKDLSNTNGAVDYLKYYVAQGKSILFTHDLTSMYNLVKSGKSEPFGYTPNKSLRDIMGMNRYRAVSNQLSQTERNQIIAYQSANSTDYDWINSEAKHGFTYYALKRLGWNNSGTNENLQNGYKVPYRYMVTNPNGESICGASELAKKTGFNNNNDITTKASKLNEGQITVYPYKIDDSLSIARTHGQWYELNLEDDDVTVWYTLDYDGGPTAWQGGDSNKDGTALTYAASPNDAANNYYIYSKGNVFYSGVGHSTVTGDMEAKLFVNTMIAAYRAAYEPPVIEITNQEAVMTTNQYYTIELMQEFNSASPVGIGDENQQEAEVFEDTLENEYTVKFMPVEFNVVTTQLECTIQYEDGTYIDKIKSADGTEIIADASTHKFKGLQNGQEYTLVYKKKYLSDWTDAEGTHTKRREIIFNINNNKSAAVNTTKLNMTVQPLFQLD